MRGKRGNGGKSGKSGKSGNLGNFGKMWNFVANKGCLIPRRLNDTNLNNSFVGCGRHRWRPYMMVINIVLLLWRECVLSRLFVYFRSAIVDYCTANGGGDW